MPQDNKSALEGQTVTINQELIPYEIQISESLDGFRAADARDGEEITAPGKLAELYALNRAILQTDKLYAADGADVLGVSGSLAPLRSRIDAVDTLQDALDTVQVGGSGLVGFLLTGDLKASALSLAEEAVKTAGKDQAANYVFYKTFDELAGRAEEGVGNSFSTLQEIRGAAFNDDFINIDAEDITDMVASTLTTLKAGSSLSLLVSDSDVLDGSVFDDAVGFVKGFVSGIVDPLVNKLKIDNLDDIPFNLSADDVDDLTDITGDLDAASFAAKLLGDARKYFEATETPKTEIGYLTDEALADFAESFAGRTASDGPVRSQSGDLSGAEGVISIEAPTFSADGEIDYTISLSGAPSGTQYNIAYIIDTSSSMGGPRIEDAQAAYTQLTNQLANVGIAAAANFAVVPFNSGARLEQGLDADGAIDAISGLVAFGGTQFGPALSRAETFFASANTGQANIAYFLSDGQGDGASDRLTELANVQAYGIGGGPNLATLDLIDSDSAQALKSSDQLLDAITSANVSAASLDRIEVTQSGDILDTVSSDELTDATLGLSYSGTLAGLDTGAGESAEVTATAYLDDGSVAGDVEITVAPLGGGAQVGDESPPSLLLGSQQREIDVQAAIDANTVDLTGNDLDNRISAPQTGGTFDAAGGDDHFELGDYTTSTVDRVLDGGDGYDTVSYTADYQPDMVAREGTITRVGSNTDTLSNIEEIAFSDVSIDAKTLNPLAVTGTAGRDSLEGTQGSETISSLGGRIDSVTGGGGSDEFVFGSETVNGLRERDVIRDFGPDDAIVLEDGAEVMAVRGGTGSVTVRFNGDGDLAYLRGNVGPDEVTIIDDALNMA